MTVQAVITLKTLRCIAESDRAGTSHSEPYIWPFLAGIALSPGTLETFPTHAFHDDSRKVIKEEMRQGQSAALEGPANRLTATFADDQTAHKLILVVALLEQDNTPQDAIQDGYQAFLDELRAQLGAHGLELLGATDEERESIIAGIKSRVRDKALAAIEASLSIGEMLANQDDPMGQDFRFFTGLPSAALDFTLRFAGTSGDPRTTFPGSTGFEVTHFPVEYELDGSFTVETFNVDPCQGRIDAVNAAQAAIGTLHRRTAVLRRQFQAKAATPGRKAKIRASIADIDSQRMPDAKKALARAKGSLARCRKLGGMLPQPLTGASVPGVGGTA